MVGGHRVTWRGTNARMTADSSQERIKIQNDATFLCTERKIPVVLNSIFSKKQTNK